MTWNQDPSYTSHVGSFTKLAAKDYLLVKGVWKTDANGQPILPFGGRLPSCNAIDVDSLKTSASGSHDHFRTCDALFFPSGGKDPCLIEFKDQPESNIKQHELMDKCWGSIVVLHKTLLQAHKFSDLAHNIRLVVVFSSSKGKIAQALASKAGIVRDSFNIPICWDLDYFSQVGIFSSVHTWDDAQFLSNKSAIGIPRSIIT